MVVIGPSWRSAKMVVAGHSTTVTAGQVAERASKTLRAVITGVNRGFRHRGATVLEAVGGLD
jgi:hypothetical protein